MISVLPLPKYPLHHAGEGDFIKREKESSEYGGTGGAIFLSARGTLYWSCYFSMLKGGK